jgi:hypothetical protein
LIYNLTLLSPLQEERRRKQISDNLKKKNKANSLLVTIMSSMNIHFVRCKAMNFSCSRIEFNQMRICSNQYANIMRTQIFILLSTSISPFIRSKSITTLFFLLMGNSKSTRGFADESKYKYEAPGPNDSRSPCPALNALANHGYLPHDGNNITPEVLQRAAQVYSLLIIVM